MRSDFESIIKNLSSRAKRVMADLSVKDIETLLKITPKDLIKIRGCGKKTIEEIEALQESLSETSKTSQKSDVLPELIMTPSGVFEALLGIPSKRAINILKKMGIND